MSRPLLWLAALCVGCGLLPTEPIGFRAYPLRDVSYGEGVEIVRAVTERFFREQFGGGFSIDWDEEYGNLTVSPIYDESRRLKMHIRVVPRGDAAVVEMFALVEHAATTGAGLPQWTRPMQDVPLEEKLYDAFLLELVKRRPIGG